MRRKMERNNKKNVCCEIFSVTGGQPMIFVATLLSRSQLVLGRPHSNTLISPSQTGQPGGLDLPLLGSCQQYED